MAANNYLVHNLVSDLPNIADHQDKNLVNPWGNAFSATSPFWVGDNGKGAATLYDGTGAPSSLVVNVPAHAGSASPAGVTGVISNSNTSAFLLAAGKQSQFIFCTEDGTISGWNSTVNSANAIVMVDNSASGAVYKGCAIGGTSTAPELVAANFSSGAIDVFDGNFKPVTLPAGAFTNPKISAGFAPFNVLNLGGKLYVSYAKQNSQKHDDLPGAGNGFVAVFDSSGNLLTSLVNNGPLNSPWGMAIAPAGFGDFGGALLVANFGDGAINAFNAGTGAQLGTLNDLHNNPIKIPGIWSIAFGNNGKNIDPATLYFTAGIGGGPNNDPVESHGLLGSIQAAPAFTSANVMNGASFSATLAPETWVSIVKGGGLAPTARGWQTADFDGSKLPTQLNGVGVTINGEAAPVSFISPTQINFLVPPDIAPGNALIQTTNNGLTSNGVSALVTTTAPAFFTLGTDTATGNSYIAAEHANGSIAGPANLISGVTTTPYNAGETMVLYGTGFGATNPAAPSGQLLTAALPLTATPTVTVGGIPAQVIFAGLVGPGLYQINVVLPAGATAGGTGAVVEVPVVVTAGGAQSQPKAVVAVNAGQ